MITAYFKIEGIKYKEKRVSLSIAGNEIVKNKIYDWICEKTDEELGMFLTKSPPDILLLQVSTSNDSMVFQTNLGGDKSNIYLFLDICAFLQLLINDETIVPRVLNALDN